jgi:outer membrane protein OmpA-like peptidoglycan-associated protein
MQRKLLLLGILIPLIGCAAKKPPPPLPPFTNAELIQEIQKLDLNAQETARGVTVTLPTIFFDYDKADLTPEARQKVDALSTVLNHPRALQRKLSVEGHADSIGSLDYNRKLSERRAETVLQEMVSEQVQRERLHSQGLGELYPVAPNKNPDGSDNPEGRAKNRRVEIVIEN